MTNKQLLESIINILYKWVHDKDEYGLKKMPTEQLLALIKKHEREVIEGIGEALELWFDRHDRTSKKFQSEDLIRFLKERSNYE